MAVVVARGEVGGVGSVDDCLAGVARVLRVGVAVRVPVGAEDGFDVAVGYVNGSTRYGTGNEARHAWTFSWRLWSFDRSGKR